jgi:hypothetical protein
MLTFSLEGYLDVAALTVLQDKPFKSVDTIRGHYTMDAQHVRHVLAGLGLPTGQPIEHLQAWLLAAIMFMPETLLKLGCRLSH